MKYIDFHTHRVPTWADVIAVVDGRDTWGVHPWRAEETFVVPDLREKLAIGECGLDAVRGVSMDKQLEVFKGQIELSEREEKPLIIHCVKAIDGLLRLRRDLHPKMPWMFHGFRGKPQQLRSLLAAGFYVSFGFHYNEESLNACPMQRLMLETDADDRSIADLYNELKKMRGISMSSLCTAMAENYRIFFRKEPNML
jgi:TatD DNase family protein